MARRRLDPAADVAEIGGDAHASIGVRNGAARFVAIAVVKELDRGQVTRGRLDGGGSCRGIQLRLIDAGELARRDENPRLERSCEAVEGLDSALDGATEIVRV